MSGLSELSRMSRKTRKTGADGGKFENKAAASFSTATFTDLAVDYAGSTLGFDSFLRKAMEEPELATFFGGAMPASPGSVRVVPIVQPVPVFGWWAMWRRRVPDSRVDWLAELAGPMAEVTVAEARDPAKVWMPASDRARL